MFVAIGLTTASAARAADDDDLGTMLNESVVSGASKSAEAASDAPATTVSISAADIRRYGIRSLDEAIDFLGMGLVTSNPLHSVDVGGRGVLLTSDFGNHLLLVVDGHVMNEAWDGTAYFDVTTAVPIELIDHVELVLGAGSVLYGGSAMLGVVNVVTKSAAGYKGVHFIAEGSVSPAYGIDGAFRSFAPSDLGGSYRLALGFGHEIPIGGKKLEIVGQAEFYQQSGPSFDFVPQKSYSTRTDAAGNALPDNWGPQSAGPGIWGGRSSGTYWTKVPAIHAKITYDELTVMLRAAASSRATPYVNEFNQQFGDWNDPTNHERDMWLQADAQWRHRFDAHFAMLAHGYVDAYDFIQPEHVSETSDCLVDTGKPCLMNAAGWDQWGGLELQGTQDWFADDRLVTMFGADARIRHVHAGTTDSDPSTGLLLGSNGVGDVTEVPWAAYLQQRWTPISALHLNGGLRLDSDPRGGQRLSPRLAATLATWKGGIVKAIYAEAFRAPTYYEAYFQDANQIPGNGLHPETVRSAEASIEQRWGSHRIMFGVFRTWWSDMITLALADPTKNIYQYQNTASIDNVGYNGAFEGQTGDLRYGMSITGAWTRRNTPNGTQDLTVAPSLYGNARVSYDLPGNLPIVALAAAFTGPRLADRANDGGWPVTPQAPAQVQFRLTLSDRLPGTLPLSWRVGLAYATSGVSPYVAGPNQVYAAGQTGNAAALAPVNRMSLFATLQYDLGG
jgi:outer membrane receptor protein involved in Fe transport